MQIANTARDLLQLVRNPLDNVFVLDGGFYHGGFSRKAMELFPSLQALSFEPDPETWEIASQKFARDENIEIINAALGAREGSAEFFRGPLKATNSLLPRPHSDMQPYYPQSASLVGGTMVDVVTIDGECERRNIRAIDILKLDLQGGELEALKGAQGILERRAVRIIIAEVVFVQKYHEQPLFWKICEFLSGYEYSLFSLENIKVGLYDDSQGSIRQDQWNQADAVFLSPEVRRALDS